MFRKKHFYSNILFYLLDKIKLNFGVNLIFYSKILNTIPKLIKKMLNS